MAMKRRTMLAGLLATIVAPRVAAHAADVTVGINIGVPVPPPPVIVAPPTLVVVPGSPVRYAPNASFNIFVYGDRFYSHHHGAWFVARSHRGPWRAITVERVPRAVVGVPVRYYRVPPGHAKRRFDRPGPPHGRHFDDRPGRDRGRKWHDD